MADDLLRTAEVAKMLNVSRSTVARWIALGQLEAVRLPSGRYRVRREDVEQMLRREGQDQDG